MDKDKLLKRVLFDEDEIEPGGDPTAEDGEEEDDEDDGEDDDGDTDTGDVEPEME